jgi:multisubunit Na+/H+ antiporter MnhE subunit
MLHAAAMLAGLFIIGLALTQAWTSRDDALLMLAAALVSVAMASRFGGVRASPFSTAPQFAVLLFTRADNVLNSAISTIRMALAADVTLRPALVQVRADEGNALATAAAADAISAEPGRVVVETESGAMLVHVIDEAASPSETLAKLHHRAASLMGRAR